ncbi:hypothetical protein [Sphingobium yanoikuyae]|uniref:hypothetical protein n=1 Tax=Sphingobium yanoikuyae TaxID=13690 RepID=UPI0028A88E5E|nr:hypothetical protein [Sphingobium yanoikuyae]
MPRPHPTSFQGAGYAILIAGPTFMIALTLDMICRQPSVPATWTVGTLIYASLILLFALTFGPLVACIPIMTGTVTMQWLVSRANLCTSRPAWLAAGLAMGTGLAIVIKAAAESAELSFALIATSGISGWLAYTPE